MRFSIVVKINLILLAGIIFFGSLAGGLFLNAQRRDLSEELERRIQLAGGIIAQSIEPALSKNDIATADLFLQAAALDPEIAYIMVKSLDGEILAARWVSQTAGSISEYSFPIHKRNPSISPQNSSFGAVNLSGEQKPIGQLTIGVDLTPQQTMLKKLFLTTAATLLSVGLLSSLVGLIIVRLLMRRSILPLVEGIRRIGSGELAYRFPIRNRDEFDEIGATFNEMAKQLSSTLVTKQELENIVEGRTAELHEALEERISAQKVLADREEYIHLLLNSTAEAIYAVDTNGICTICNPSCARMLGYGSPEEILGKNIHELVHHSRENGSSYPADECPIFNAFREVTEYHSDQEVFWKADGTSINVEFWSFPIFKGDQVVGAVATFLDITERIQLTNQLIQSQKMESIGSLAGGVAHDFNNLLTPIIGYAQILEEDLPGDSTATEHIGHILQAANKAKDLVMQLLSFSRKQILEMKIINLNQVVENLIPMLRRTIRENIDIKVRLSEEEHIIQGDENQICQIIMNLVLNAQDAIPSNGTISIETSQTVLDEEYASSHQKVTPGKYLMLAVTDNGTGMDMETQQRIFEPFFTTKGVGKGTGLGLATVYGIVRQHGGNIWVYSEPSRGTTFKVYFPLAEGPVSSMKEEKPSIVHLAGMERLVLLVEDNEMVRDMVCKMLKQHDFEVIAAETPLAALAQAAGRKLDLLVTDVVMPDMTGPQLFSQLASTQPGLRVLYMSGYTDNAIFHQVTLDEGVSFIQKPFTRNDLAQKILNLIG